MLKEALEKILEKEKPKKSDSSSQLTQETVKDLSPGTKFLLEVSHRVGGEMRVRFKEYELLSVKSDGTIYLPGLSSIKPIKGVYPKWLKLAA